MELTAVAPIVDRLFADVEAYKLSHEGRSQLATPDPNLVYGEIVAQTMADVLAVAKPRPGEVFCDLGSGTGKAVFLACLLADFSRGVGIELVKPLGDAARRVLARYDAEVRPTLPAAQQAQELSFVDGDLLKADLAAVDVVYAHTTCFQTPLVTSLTAKLAELKPGARMIVIGMPLDDAPHLIVFHVDRVQMDFGLAPVCVYRRSNEPAPR